MKSQELEHYKLNQNLLSLLGLWAENDSWSDRARRSFCGIILITGIVFQVMVFVVHPFEMDLFLVSVPNIMFIMTAFVKYCQFCFGSNLKLMIRYIREDWKRFTDDGDIQIMKHYAKHTQVMTLLFASFVYMGLLGIGSAVTLPLILDTIAPRNETRVSIFPVVTEYFVDPIVYRLPIHIHILLFGVISTTMVIATESMLTLIVKHVCGLMKITSRRMQEVLNDEGLSSMIPTNYVIMQRKMARAIRLHTVAINFSELIKTTFGTHYCVLLVIGISAISINLFRLSRALSLNEIGNAVVVVTSLGVQISYIALSNYIGQDVIDHSSGIFDDVYATYWYNSSIPMQKLLAIIMMRSMKNCDLMVGGLFVPSFEGFSTSTSMALSYFTVLYSLQH